jgi:hypothetical protein
VVLIPFTAAILLFGRRYLIAGAAPLPSEPPTKTVAAITGTKLLGLVLPTYNQPSSFVIPLKRKIPYPLATPLLSQFCQYTAWPSFERRS